MARVRISTSDGPSARGWTKSRGSSTWAAITDWLAQPKFEYGSFFHPSTDDPEARSSGHWPHAVGTVARTPTNERRIGAAASLSGNA